MQRQKTTLLHTHMKIQDWCLLKSKGLVCWRNQSERILHGPRTNMHHPPNDQERSKPPVNHTKCHKLVRFPVLVKLSHIFHTLWCHSVNSIKFQTCVSTTPWIHKFGFLVVGEKNNNWVKSKKNEKKLQSTAVTKLTLFKVEDYNGIWSSLFPSLWFLINGKSLAARLRCRLSHNDLRISPLTLKYTLPRRLPFLTNWSKQE